MIKKINNVLILVVLFASLIFSNAFAVDLNKARANKNAFRNNFTHQNKAANRQAGAQDAISSIQLANFQKNMQNKMDSLKKIRDRDHKASLNISKKLTARAADFKKNFKNNGLIYKKASEEIDLKINAEETAAKRKEQLSQRVDIAVSQSDELEDLMAEATSMGIQF